MTDDRQAIRDLIATWIAASKAGDINTVLALIDEDALFHVPGVKPFGKSAFAAASDRLKQTRFEAESEVLEVEICNDWAWCRTRLAMTMLPAEGKPIRRSGYTLSVLRRSPEGKWQLFRDANLLAEET